MNGAKEGVKEGMVREGGETAEEMASSSSATGWEL